MSAIRSRRTPAKPKPQFGLVWDQSGRLERLGAKLIKSSVSASWDAYSDAEGRTSVMFSLRGFVEGASVDDIICLLEGIRSRKAS